MSTERCLFRKPKKSSTAIVGRNCLSIVFYCDVYPNIWIIHFDFIVTLEGNILIVFTSFVHPQVLLKPYFFLLWNKNRCSEECSGSCCSYIKIKSNFGCQFFQTHPIPPNWQYQDARKLFFETPKVDDPVLAWSEPDEEGLVQFLCKERPLKYISVF